MVCTVLRCRWLIQDHLIQRPARLDTPLAVPRASASRLRGSPLVVGGAPIYAATHAPSTHIHAQRPRFTCCGSFLICCFQRCQPTHNQKRADKLERNGCRGKRFGGFTRSEELTFAQESAELENHSHSLQPAWSQEYFHRQPEQASCSTCGLRLWAQALSL